MLKNRPEIIEKKLNRVIASFRLEGEELSAETIQRCRLIIEHKLTADEAIALAINSLG